MATIQRFVFGANKESLAPVNKEKQPTLDEIRKNIKGLEEIGNLGQRQVNDLTMTSNGYTALNTLLAVVAVIIIVPLAILVSVYAFVGFLPLLVIGLTLAILAARKDSDADKAKSELKNIEIRRNGLQAITQD